jgi:hypothetical protein
MVLLTANRLGQRISPAQMAMYQSLGNCLEQITPARRRIGFKGVNLRIPKGAGVVLRGEIERGNIFILRNGDRITFLRKLTNGAVGYEEIGSVTADDLVEGKREQGLAGCLDAFRVLEKPINPVNRKRNTLIIRIEGMEIRFSTNPNNVVYKEIKKGNIYYQRWPDGRVLIIKKGSGEPEVIGETSVNQMRAYLEELGKPAVKISDLIDECGVQEAAIIPSFRNRCGLLECTFDSRGIAYNFTVADDVIYAKDIREGRLYRRVYADGRIVLGIKSEDKFKPLGEVNFDAKGRIVKDGKLFLVKNKPVRQMSGKRPSVRLKFLIPKLASVEREFRFYTSKRKKGNDQVFCQVLADNHHFALPSWTRNIYKKGQGRKFP